MRKFLLILIAVLFVTPHVSYSKEALDLGFAPGNVWFSLDEFFDGDTVEIKTFLFNCRSGKLSGTVEFFDGEANIGGTDFNLGGGCSAVVVGTSWIAESGLRAMSAKMTEVVFVNSGGEKEDLIFKNIQTEIIEKNIDVDTDGDGVGNRVDVDDDGDGLSDEDEIKIGSDPLKKDTDGDGFLDNEDKEPTVFNSKVLVGVNGAILSDTESKKIIPKEVVLSAKNVSKEVSSALDIFRKTQVENLSRIKDKFNPNLKKQTDTGIVKNKQENKRVPISFIKPIDYVVYIFATVAMYVFNKTILFYIFIFGVIYYVFKIIRRYF